MMMPILKPFRSAAAARLVPHLPLPLINRYYVYRTSWRLKEWLSAPYFLIHVPKSAGKAIARATGIIDPGHILFSDFSTDIRAALVRKPCLAVVRDPASRIVSTFNYIFTSRRNGRVNLINGLDPGRDVNEFIARMLIDRRMDRHYFFRPAAVMIDDARSFGADVDVVPFADLDKRVRSLLQGVGLDVPEIPKENVSTERISTDQDLSARSREALRWLYARDYQLFESR